jgi:hypothetical protein
MHSEMQAIALMIWHADSTLRVGAPNMFHTELE